MWQFFKVLFQIFRQEASGLEAWAPCLQETSALNSIIVFYKHFFNIYIYICSYMFLRYWCPDLQMRFLSFKHLYLVYSTTLQTKCNWLQKTIFKYKEKVYIIFLYQAVFTGQSHCVILWLMLHACISSLDLSTDSSFTLFKYVILNMKLAPAQIKSLFYGKWVAFVRVEDYLKIHM